MMKRIKEGMIALVLALVVIAGHPPEVQAQTPAGLTISPQALTISEGSTVAFTVMLNTMPSENVRVVLSGLMNDHITLAPTHLDFDPENWNVPQSVQVTAANDHDAINERATLTLTATGSDYSNVRGTMGIEVRDDDRPGLAIAPHVVVIDEGSSGSFILSLATEPSDPVEVTIGQPSNPGVRVSTRSLNFSAVNWNTPQRVIVRAVEDSDLSNETAEIPLTARGGDYGGQAGIVQVTVIDRGDPLPPTLDDYALIVSDPSMTLEEGGSGRFEVRLKTRPRGNVTVNFILPDHSDVTLDSDTLIFTPANWGTEQPVEVVVGEDADFSNDSVRIELVASGGGYGIANARGRVDITVIDNDTFGSALILSPKNLTLNEGESGTFTVRLSLRPGAEVNVVLSQTSNPDIRFDTDANRPGNQNSLIFTSQNWNIPRPVSVFAAQDNDAIEDRATISLMASGGGYIRIENELPVSVIDDDPPPGLILFPSREITVSEGDSGIFTLRLATRPSGEVTLTLIQPSNSDIRVDTDSKREGFQNKLVFGLSNWAQEELVIVSANRDNRYSRTEVSIVAAGAEEYAGMTTQLSVIAIESDPSLAWESRGAIPAISPPNAQDMTTIRISCKEDGVPCDVFLDCTAQDGTIYRGRMSPIPSMGARVLSTRDVVSIVGGDWSGKGRLLCSLRSQEIVSGQIWTRSGDGVLVNNTQSLRSAEVADALGRTYHRVDIESIPSPDDSDLSNIRIRCEGGNDCTDVVFECYEDDGTLYSGVLGLIGRAHTRHIQTQELSSMIGHRWQGMTLTCEVRSDHPFSVQVLTRTGGGGALVNNSATSAYRDSMEFR